RRLAAVPHQLPQAHAHRVYESGERRRAAHHPLSDRAPQTPRHQHAIWEEILTEFAAAPDIDLAYHTTRGFKYTEEGKPALRAPPAHPLPSELPVDDD